MSVTFSPAIQGQFGERRYYITTMKAEHAARNIRLPSSLFETSARALDLRMQRELDKSKRVGVMAAYLENAYRFYGPLVVALNGGNPEFVPLEMADPNQLVPVEDFQIGVLRFSGDEEYFVLDGQHRLASIRAAIEKGNEDVKQDEVSLVIVQHEDDQAGVEKTRRLFTHLNRYAVKTNKTENITIDEDDGYAIVTRRLVREHPVLKDKIWYGPRALPENRTDGEPPNQIHSAECFTTLETVYECNKTLLKSVHKYKDEWVRIRPDDDLLDQLTEECTKFWDALRLIEPIGLVAEGHKKCSDFRPYSEAQRPEGHLLFRPIGQQALAEAAANIIQGQKSGFDGIDPICQSCNGIDWTLSSPPWAGLYFGDNKMLGDITSMRVRVGSNLLRFMLGEDWPNPEQTLLKDYRAAVYRNDSTSPEAMQLTLPSKVS